MHNMRYAMGLGSFDRASVGVLGFMGPDGNPRSCAVTPYVIDGNLIVSSTLAYLAKVRAIARHPSISLFVDGVHASAEASIEMHRSPDWFDQHLRDQERLKYPPARTLLALPFHRRVLWWYVGRAVITFDNARFEDVAGSDGTTVTTLENGRPRIRPLHRVALNGDVVDVANDIPDGPAILLAHDEDDDMAELRQLALRGTVVGGRLHVDRRSGSLNPTHPAALDQLRALRAMGRAASANRSQIENWQATR